jgi:hypothetical protein
MSVIQNEQSEVKEEYNFFPKKGEHGKFNLNYKEYIESGKSQLANTILRRLYEVSKEEESIDFYLRYYICSINEINEIREYLGKLDYKTVILQGHHNDSRLIVFLK